MNELTDAELLLLGLTAETPRHGYQIEQLIAERGMREWTQIGFSSIYFVLAKLEKAGFVASQKPRGAKARKRYAATEAGRAALAARTLAALAAPRPTHSPVLLGMAHWPVLDHDAALGALRARGTALAAEIMRLEHKQATQQPLPAFVDAMFDHTLGQLCAEAEWVERTLAVMQSATGLK